MPIELATQKTIICSSNYNFIRKQCTFSILDISLLIGLLIIGRVAWKKWGKYID